MPTYNEYFNMHNYVVDPNIKVHGESLVLDKTYNEITDTTVVLNQSYNEITSAARIFGLQHIQSHPKKDKLTGVEIQKEPEPAPMVEVNWEDAYPKSMKPVENVEELWTPVDNVTEEVPEDAVEVKIETQEVHVDDPVIPTVYDEVIDEPAELIDLTEEDIDNSVEESPVEITEEKTVVKKKHTKRSKKK